MASAKNPTTVDEARNCA